MMRKAKLSPLRDEGAKLQRVPTTQALKRKGHVPQLERRREPRRRRHRVRSLRRNERPMAMNQRKVSQILRRGLERVSRVLNLQPDVAAGVVEGQVRVNNPGPTQPQTRLNQVQMEARKRLKSYR